MPKIKTLAILSVRIMFSHTASSRQYSRVLRSTAGADILKPSMMSSAQSRTLLSLLVIMALLFGLVIGPFGSHSGPDCFVPVASLLSLLALNATFLPRFERHAIAKFSDPLLPAAPDRAPPPAILSIV